MNWLHLFNLSIWCGQFLDGVPVWGLNIVTRNTCHNSVLCCHCRRMSHLLCFLRATWPKWSKMVKNNAFSFWTHAMNMQDSGPVYICTYISCTYTYVYPFMSYVHFVYTCIEILSMYTRLSEHSVIVVPEVGKDSLGAGHAETLLKNMSRKGFFPPKNPTASLGCWGSGIL